MSGSDLERILKIINAVRKHECLWNVNCSDYAKRDKLEKAWKDIALEVGKSEVFCREKWRNVRTGFLRSIQHQIRRTSHDENATIPNDFHAVKRKRFYLYDQMAFLLPSAETLEQTRKKRKLSKDNKSMVETDDDVIQNDTDGDNSILTTYNMVGKFETNEDSANEDEEVEHHTLLINGDVYTVNDNTDCNIDEILKEIEHNKNKRNIKLTKPTENQKDLTLEHKNKDNENKLNNIDLSACTNKKVIHMISEQVNDNLLTKSNENFNSSTKNPCEPTPDQPQQFSQRDEQQLLHFFRSCTDDILSLNKRKQRLFKKRILDLIEELYDSS